MDDLVKLVSQKTGITEEQAQMAVEIVLDYLKDKLPEPLDSMIDNLLEGDKLPTDLLSGLGGLFGK